MLRHIFGLLSSTLSFCRFIYRPTNLSPCGSPYRSVILSHFRPIVRFSIIRSIVNRPRGLYTRRGGGGSFCTLILFFFKFLIEKKRFFLWKGQKMFIPSAKNKGGWSCYSIRPDYIFFFLMKTMTSINHHKNTQILVIYKIISYMYCNTNVLR